MELVRLWIPVLVGMLTMLVPSIGIAFVALYRLGRMEKEFNEEKTKNLKLLVDMAARHEKDLDAVKAEHKETLKTRDLKRSIEHETLGTQIKALKESVDERLFERGGELRYVTTRACEGEQSHCRDRMTVILNGINEHLAGIRGKVDCLDDLKVRVDILERKGE